MSSLKKSTSKTIPSKKEPIAQQQQQQYYRIAIKNKHKQIIAYTLVDKQDYDTFKLVNFHLQDGFAYNIRYLHRLIMNHIPKNKIVYHLNGNKLDNRRANLKVAQSGSEYYYFLKNKQQQQQP